MSIDDLTTAWPDAVEGLRARVRGNADTALDDAMLDIVLAGAAMLSVLDTYQRKTLHVGHCAAAARARRDWLDASRALLRAIDAEEGR